MGDLVVGVDGCFIILRGKVSGERSKSGMEELSVSVM